MNTWIDSRTHYSSNKFKKINIIVVVVKYLFLKLNLITFYIKIVILKTF
jgi:hypothetical protein